MKKEIENKNPILIVEKDKLYDVEIKRINEAVNRNREKFPKKHLNLTILKKLEILINDNNIIEINYASNRVNN